MRHYYNIVKMQLHCCDSFGKISTNGSGIFARVAGVGYVMARNTFEREGEMFNGWNVEARKTTRAERVELNLEVGQRLEVVLSSSDF